MGRIVPEGGKTGYQRAIEALLTGLRPPTIPGVAARPSTPETFFDFVSRVAPTYRWFDYNRRLADALQRVADGELRRLMVFMPPRIGKTELVSRLFPAYYLTRHPNRNVGLSSYGAALAHKLSKDALRNYEAANGPLRYGAARAASYWETGLGGTLWATGVGGSSTGRGFHLGVCDDPVKDAQEALSQIKRNKNKDWWEQVWYTRQEADFPSALVIVMTRWHLDDLAGWLLAREGAASESGMEMVAEGWHVLSMPMVAEDKPFDVPATCTLEPDWREPGGLLCPERFGEEEVARRRGSMTAHAWSSLFQQQPVPAGGSLAKWDDFKVVRAMPADWTSLVRYWDLAGTEGGGDETCGALVGLDPEHGFPWVADIAAGHWSLARRDEEIVATAKRDREAYGSRVEWVIEQDTGMGGAERTAALIARAGAWVTVRTYKPSGSKVNRADPFYAQVQAGNVRILDADWTFGTRRQLCDFPYSEHDDRVDAIAGAYNRAAEIVRDAGGSTESIFIVGV